MGYQTPDLTNIGSLDLANQGRDELARDIKALQLQRGEHQPYTTIVGHSYGSTAALMALTEYDFTVDALALVGTPGSAAQSSHDLHVRGNNVWVGSAAWDPVPSSAWFGSDPAAPSYGAHTMGVGGTTDVITGESLSQSIGHNEYFDPGTESMRNLALIGIGHAELVMRGVPSDSTRTLATAR
jgi:pimeloyl-ACP methyl ester carboxylesterase